MFPSAADIMTGVVVLVHAGIAAAEWFCWPMLTGTHRRLGLSPEAARQATPIVRNAGLYNAFLAVGLGAALWAGVEWRTAQQLCLGFAAIAGLVGAVTLSRLTLIIQTAPAAAALGLLWAG